MPPESERKFSSFSEVEATYKGFAPQLNELLKETPVVYSGRRAAKSKDFAGWTVSQGFIFDQTGKFSRAFFTILMTNSTVGFVFNRPGSIEMIILGSQRDEIKEFNPNRVSPENYGAIKLILEKLKAKLPAN